MKMEGRVREKEWERERERENYAVDSNCFAWPVPNHPVYVQKRQNYDSAFFLCSVYKMTRALIYVLARRLRAL